MSAVDIPPGLEFVGTRRGEFRGRRRSRRLATFVSIVTSVLSVVTFVLAARSFHKMGTTLLFIGPLVCCSVCFVGLAIRRARVRIEDTGIHWGWGELGFRVSRDRLQEVVLFRGGLAIKSGRSQGWYLSQYDWEAFDTVAGALQRAKLPYSRKDSRAPFRSRMQGYGPVLDGLLVMALLGSLCLLFFALIR